MYADLHRDKAIGVIEPVPIRELVSWCHRMVVTRTHDGSPRKTVNHFPLNKHYKREAHNTKFSFHLGKQWLTHGMDNIAFLFESLPPSHHIHHTNWWWRYKKAPQGFLSSGDGYNRRFDAVLAEFPCKVSIVDDTLHYDKNLTEHWWRTIDFLILLGNASIVLNPEKFQFAQKEVSFAGFHTWLTPPIVLELHHGISHSLIYSQHKELIWVCQLGFELCLTKQTYGPISNIPVTPSSVWIELLLRWSLPVVQGCNCRCHQGGSWNIRLAASNLPSNWLVQTGCGLLSLT